MSIQVFPGTKYELYESAQECKAKENQCPARKAMGMRHVYGCSGRAQEPALLLRHHLYEGRADRWGGLLCLGNYPYFIYAKQPMISEM